MYDHYKALLIERRGAVLVVTMNNPPMNPMTPEMHTELSTIFFDIDRDPQTKVVVLTGAGRAFTAGGNIHNMIRRIEEHDSPGLFAGLNEAKAILDGLLRLRVPVIARINGHAMGLGATLAAFCDISIMVDTAKIADSHVSVGLVAGDGGALIWPMRMGFARAKEYLLTGDPLTGRQAAEMGLINHAVPAEELDAKVFALAERLATGASRAINGTKVAINMLLRRQFEGLIEAHLGLEAETFHTRDHHEAALAFRDKRPPQFEGR
jgi:enoyl-CoA hydratase